MTTASLRLAAFARAAAAVSVGLASFLYFFDARILDPTDLSWVGAGDFATNFLGWHFTRNESWSWPPGLLKGYGDGLVASIALTDSIALVAMPLKPFQALLPVEFNYLGIWIALSFALQGLFGYRLLCAMGVQPIRAVACAGVFCVMPMLAARATLHVPLASHFVILAAFETYIASTRQPSRFAAWCILIPATALIQAYLLIAIAPVFIASAAALLWKGDADTRRAVALRGALAASLGVLALYLVGYFAVDVTPTWGFYGQLQVNLLAWFNPQGTGRLLPNLPLADVSQTDAYMYLGAGVLGLCAFGSLQLLRERPRLNRVFVPLALAALALLLVAATHRVAVGPYFLTSPVLPVEIQERLNVFRSSGRLAWVPTYLAIAIVVAACARTRMALFWPALFAAIAINLYDLQPLRARAHAVSDHKPRPPTNCASLGAAAAKVVFIPRVNLEDRSISSVFDLAVCAARQRQAINVAHLARMNIPRAEAASLSAASRLRRPVDPDVAYAFRNPAVAALLGSPAAAAPSIGAYRIYTPGIPQDEGPSIWSDPAWAWPLDIDLGVNGEGRDVTLAGWSPPLHMIWTVAQSASLLLPAAAPMPGGARLSIMAGALPFDSGEVPVGIRVNGIDHGSLRVVASQGLKWHGVTISPDIIRDSGGALQVDFELPPSPPIAPRRLYPSDRLRLMATRLHMQALEAGVTRARFDAASRDISMLGPGWSNPENWGTWSLGKEGEIRVPMPANRKSGLMLRALGHGFSRGSRQEVEVLVGAKSIASWVFTLGQPSEWREALVPAELLPESGDLPVRFRIANPASPSDEDGKDRRVLGFGLVQVELRSR
jgi:hypothetical protein